MMPPIIIKGFVWKGPLNIQGNGNQGFPKYESRKRNNHCRNGRIKQRFTFGNGHIGLFRRAKRLRYK